MSKPKFMLFDGSDCTITGKAKAIRQSHPKRFHEHTEVGNDDMKWIQFS